MQHDVKHEIDDAEAVEAELEAECEDFGVVYEAPGEAEINDLAAGSKHEKRGMATRKRRRDNMKKKLRAAAKKRNREEAERRAELERSEYMEAQKQAQLESSVQAQSLQAAEAELMRMQVRETVETEARQAAERDKAEVQRLASMERSEHAESRRQAEHLIAEQLQAIQAAQDEVVRERTQHTEAMESVQAEVSRMQEAFQVAGTPPQSPRVATSPAPELSAITQTLQMTAEATREELHRRAESVDKLRAELAKVQEEAH